MGVCITQPFLISLDLSKSDNEIVAETKALCMASAGYESIAIWRSEIGKQMATVTHHRASADS